MNCLKTRQKKYFDKKTKARRFSPGDNVLVLLPTDANKLLVQWKGPYGIINTEGPNDYKVEINGKEKTTYANLLKKYLSRNEETSSRVPDVSSQMISTFRRVWLWLRTTTTRQVRDMIKTI